MIFDFTAYDANAGLDVAAKIYDIDGGSPVLDSTVTLDHIVNGSYYGDFTPDPTKEYLVSIAAYTDGTFTTLHTDYTPSSEVIQIDSVAAPLAAIKAKTDQLTFVGGGVAASVIDSQLEMKKNADFANFTFPMSSSSSNLPMLALTVTAEVSIDGAAFTSCVNTPTEIGNGMYTIDLDADDLNGDSVVLKFTGTGAFQRTISLYPRG